MSNNKTIPIYEVFPFLKGGDKLTADFSGALVSSVTINEANLSMSIDLSLAAPVPPLEISFIESLIASEYGMSSVTVSAYYSRASASAKNTTGKSGKNSKPGSIIMGKQIKGPVKPVKDLALELGKATVRGEVCNVASKRTRKTGAWLLDFDLTDYTSTVHIFKYLREESAESIISSIKPGMWLTVSGKLVISNYDDELVLEPINIETAEKISRVDNAPEKRVELHMHTKMSARDATTDVSELIKRAAEWGHPAVAITDHGVVHSFPDAVAASCDGVKIIYGVEGYFQNDVEYYSAVNNASGPINGDVVVFDIETTGLAQTSDIIIEIGAVFLKDGLETKVFHTYVNPGIPIPYEITELTGIKDADVAGAPSEEDAVRGFIEFVGGRTLVAHNAGFDVGFIYEVCLKYGITFTPSYVDTLALSRVLLPSLKNYRLNTVAEYYAFNDFNHHSAADDAGVTARIFTALIGMLNGCGVTEFENLNKYLTERRKRDMSAPGAKKHRQRNRHIIILARNKTGLHNLYKLVTKSHLEDFDKSPIITKSCLDEHREGLIIGTACEAGELFNAITSHAGTLSLEQIANYYDYLEIQPICNNVFMLEGDKPRARSIEDLRDFNRRIVALGDKLGKPVVATGDVHFLDPEHEIFRHILLNSKGFDNADAPLPVFYRTTDEMLDEFEYLGKEKAFEVVVTNTRKISDMCEVISPLPEGKTLFAPKLEGSAADLKLLVDLKLHKIYGENPPEIVIERYQRELDVILSRGYDVIYMSAQKIVADSISNGYLVGSRGSVGSSLVAFLAGITEINSLPAHYICPICKHSDFEAGGGFGCGADMPESICPVCGAVYAKDGFNIPFETFLGFDGDKVPDIDLNFSGEYQMQAHKFASSLFGEDFVYRAGTISKIAEKTAYGYVKKHLETIGVSLPKAEENRLARGCVGVKRTTGQHPGGLVVIPQDKEITDFCPAQHPADSVDKGVITTHFEYHCMEDNLLKLDLLGHDDPTMLKMLEDLTGVKASDIRLDDHDTMALFKSPAPLGLPDGDDIIGATGSIGIPEFGTDLTRNMLSDTKPDRFDTLVRLSGFSHGENVWLGNAKELILSGKATVGETIACRDDITIFLISKGIDERYAFKISESVRKGRGLPEGSQDDMTRHGIPEWYIDSCKRIAYLFPRAHAAAYVIMAFRIAWFKVHKPLEFYSAYFYRRSQKDAFDAKIMTQGVAAARSKIKALRSANDLKGRDDDLLTTLEACYEFYMRGFSFASLDLYESDPVKFLIADEKTLRPPFVAVSGLGDTAAQDIAEKRVGREFISIDDISSSCPKVSKTHLEQLKALGALRNLPESSQMSLF